MRKQAQLGPREPRAGAGTRHGHRGELDLQPRDCFAEEAEIEGMPAAEGGGTSGLTRAELRLLPLLSTHLSFREIGERLFVSRNTIKTQAISVYRKLGVSSRSDAIARASELGLVDAGVGNGAPGPTGDLQSAAS